MIFFFSGEFVTKLQLIQIIAHDSYHKILWFLNHIHYIQMIEVDPPLSVTPAKYTTQSKSSDMFYVTVESRLSLTAAELWSDCVCWGEELWRQIKQFLLSNESLTADLLPSRAPDDVKQRASSPLTDGVLMRPLPPTWALAVGKRNWPGMAA